MKTLLRNTLVNTAALFILTLIFPGITITGGFPIVLLGGVVLTIMNITIKPIISIVSFPFLIVTMGLFHVFANVIILYLLTIMLPKISVDGFIYEGARFAGFVIPRMDINAFFAYVLAAMVISLIMTIFNWLIK